MTRLRESLKRSRITQTEAGEWLGVSNAAMNAYLTGKTPMKLDDAVIVADKLGLSLDWLTGRTDDPGQRVSPQEQAWVVIGRAIQEEGPEAVARMIDPKPQYAKPVGRPVIVVKD